MEVSKSHILRFLLKQWIGGHDKEMNNWDKEQQTNNGGRNSKLIFEWNWND